MTIGEGIFYSVLLICSMLALRSIGRGIRDWWDF